MKPEPKPDPRRKIGTTQEDNRKSRKKLTAAINGGPNPQNSYPGVIIGAGFAGTVAAMHDPRCLVIDGSKPDTAAYPLAHDQSEGIEEAYCTMVQNWNDVKFPVPPINGYGVSQPHEFVPYDSYVSAPEVTLEALESARAQNEKDFGLKIMNGTVTEVHRGDSFVSLKVTPMFVDENGHVTTGNPIKIYTSYLIIAIGEGGKPKKFSTVYNAQTEPIFPILKNGIRLGLADVELMYGIGSKFQKEARKDKWLISGVNAGSVSVAAYLLKQLVPPENITMFASETDLDALPGLSYFDAYQEFFAVCPPRPPEKSPPGKITFVEGLSHEKVDITLKPGAPTTLKVLNQLPNSQDFKEHDANHFVTAFNMQNEVFNVSPKVPGILDPTYKAKVWELPETGPGPRTVVGVRLFSTDKKGKENWIPIAILGAATTNLSSHLFGPDQDPKTLLTNEITDKRAHKKAVYTLSSIPSLFPKIAAGTLLLRYGK